MTVAATSSNSFVAVAGTTYYIALYLSADNPAANPGNYVLNWKEQPAPASGSVPIHGQWL